MMINFEALTRMPDGLEKYLRGGMGRPLEMPGLDYWRSEYAKDPAQAAGLFELELAFNKFAFRNSNQHSARQTWRDAYRDDKHAGPGLVSSLHHCNQHTYHGNPCNPQRGFVQWQSCSAQSEKQLAS